MARATAILYATDKSTVTPDKDAIINQNVV